MSGIGAPTDGWLDADMAAALQGLTVEAKAVRRVGARLVRDVESMDLRHLRSGLADWATRLRRLAEVADSADARLKGYSLPVGDPSALAGYATVFQRTVERAGVHLEGDFPHYQAFPIEIHIDLAQEQATVNRRRLHTLDPAALANAVVREYRRVHAGAFSVQRFMRALAGAYDLLLAGEPARQVAVQQVPLRRIHDVLVLRSGPSEYTLTNFAFDIYRLRNTTDLIFDGRKFYFGYTRGRSGAIPVPTSPGRYENLSVLEMLRVEAEAHG